MLFSKKMSTKTCSKILNVTVSSPSPNHDAGQIHSIVICLLPKWPGESGSSTSATAVIQPARANPLRNFQCVNCVNRLNHFDGLRASTSVAGTCQVGGTRGHGHTEQPVIAAFPPSCGIVSLVSFNGNLLWVRTQNYQRLRNPHFDPYPRSPGSRVRPKPPSAWVWAGFLALSLGGSKRGGTVFGDFRKWG